MNAIATSMTPETLSAAFLYRAQDPGSGQIDHPTPPADDDDEAEIETEHATPAADDEEIEPVQ